MTSKLLNLERLKEIREGGLETIAGLLEESVFSLKDLKSIDLKELEIPFIFDFEKDFFRERFEERFFYIHSEERQNLLEFCREYKKKSWLYLVGPEGSFEFVIFFF